MFERNRQRTTNRAIYIQNLEAYLFQPAREDIRIRTDELIRENVRLGGDKLGFRYRNAVFSLHPTRHFKHIPKASVPKEIQAVAQEILADRIVLNADQRTIANGVACILPLDCTRQDVRDALPDYLRCDMLATLELKRTRPEAYLIRDNPQKMSEWEKVRDLIERYMVTRFVRT